MLNKFLKILATYLPSKLLPALTSFITAPILTHLFLPAEYGYYALALGLSDLLGAIAVSGFGSGAVRFFPVYKNKSELGVFFATLLSSICLTVGVVCAVVSLILFLLRDYLPPALAPQLWISLLIFVVQSAYIVFMEVLRAQEKSVLYTRLNLLVSYAGLGIGLLLVIVFGFSIEGLLWGTFLALALALPFVLRLATQGVKVSVQHVRTLDTLQMWRYAWPLALGNMAFWGLRLSDRYLIGLFRSASEVGLYAAAYNLSYKSIDILVSLFVLSMGPIVMNVWENQGRVATENLITVITRIFLIICLPAAAGLTVLAYPIIALLTAKAYHDGYRIVGYVVFSGFAYGLAMIAGRGLLIGKETFRFATNLIVAALVNLGLNLWLIPQFGFVVAGFTTLVGYVLLLALQVRSARSYFTWRFPWMTLRNTALATLLMSLTTWGIYSLSGSMTELHLGYMFVSIAVAIPVFFASLWLLGEISGEEKNAAKQFLVNKILRKQRAED